MKATQSKNMFMRFFFILYLFSIGNLFAGMVEDLANVRAAGLGGAFTGWADDTNAIIYNPAGLDTIERKTFGAGYNVLSEDINQQVINIIIPTIESGVVGLYANLLDLGTFQNRDSSGNIVKSFKRQEIRGFLSYGKKVYRKFYLGGNLKYYNINLAGLSSANGLSFDIACLIKYGTRYSAGIILKDPLGVKVTDENSIKQNLAMPAIRAGLGLRILDSLLFVLDGESSALGNSISAGVELNAGRFNFRFGDNLYLKGGNNITAGVGIDLAGKISLDYAIAYMTDLDLRHSAFLSIKLGKTADELWQMEQEKLKEEQARKESEDKINAYISEIKSKYDNENWEEAKTKCEEALKISPTNREINEYYQNSKKKIKELKITEYLTEIKKQLQDKKWDEAISFCEEALVLEPGNKGIADCLNTAKKEKGYMTIAVVDLTALPPVSESDVAFISEFLRNGIVQTKRFKVVDKKNMENIMAEQGFQQTGCTTEECIIKIGKILNVQKIVSGTCGKLGDYYVLSLKITAVETSEILNTAKVSWGNLNPDIVDKKIQEVIESLLK